MATTFPAEASSRVLSDDSVSPSPAVKKKKAKLIETIAADVENLKEQLKADIYGGK